MLPRSASVKDSSQKMVKLVIRGDHPGIQLVAGAMLAIQGAVKLDPELIEAQRTSAIFRM